MSLLVSTGDSTRPGTACDTITAITAARAQALTSAGYTVVGRYLSNAPTAGSLNKQLQPGELAALAAGGMRVVPIYQTFGNSVERFSRSSGTADALHAIARARYHGFRPGTRIYFAVDFDALDYQVTENILPHFRALHATLREYGPEYEIGIYAPRNVCSRISAEGLSTASFVCGMSTAFSGNLGYPLPEDWAFDQIATKYVGTGSSGIAIDNNIASGRDTGQNQFNASVGGNELDVEFDSTLRDGLLADVRAYLESVETPETGGPERFEFTTRSNGTSFEVVMALDGVITGLARTLRLRKALIQAPLLWEVRKYNPEDIAADEQVISYHEGRLVPPAVGRRDCSTGLGQIVGATAIAARNYCISENIISGTAADANVDAELYAVWRRLRDDNVYNVSTLPLVLIHAARLINARRPAPDYTEDETRQAMSRYNGTGDAAQNYGQVTLGLYRVFEAYNAPLR